MSLECKFFFEELQLPEFGEGALFYGEAILKDNSGDTETFVVDAIWLGDARLERPNRDGPVNLSQALFKAIEAVLYDEKTVNGRHAALEWADAVEQRHTPAYTDVFRPRPGLLKLIVQGGANMQAAE